MLPERFEAEMSPDPAPVRGERLYAEVFLVSLAVIVLEVSYTRVFSFKLVYYFTYLIIGISLLGLGAGGVLVAIFPRLRHVTPGRLIPSCCLAAAGAVLVGYFVVAVTQLNAFALIDSVVPFQRDVLMREGAKLALICGLLFAPFLAAGIALATIFATRAADFPRLYFADLLGAALGCAAVVPLIATISPPGCVLLTGFLFTLAAMRLAAAPIRLVLLALGAVLLVLAVMPSWLPDPVPDQVKKMSPQRRPSAPPHFSRWSPVFRVDVLDNPGQREPGYMIAHDGETGSMLPRFDGNVSSLGWFDSDSRSHPFKLLHPHPSVAIIGAAGGHEILASLYFDAAHVTAIELNPVTVSLLTTHFADFTGHIAEHPRVTLVNAEGRTFIHRSDAKYDLIWFVAPDTYAAMNAASAGAFVLSESYLYTREMILDSLAHLTDDGIICVQFGELHESKPIRTARYLSTARDAFRQLGVEDFYRHVLVGSAQSFLTLSTILLKRTPFTEEDARRFIANSAVVRGGRVLHSLGRDARFDAVSSAIALPDDTLEKWYASYPYDLRPVTDDSPFFWHFVPFSDAFRDVPSRSFEEATGERLLLLLLVVATAFASIFLLLPFVAIHETWRAVPHKAMAGAYFASLGLGFMLFEVSLIQTLTLFLGYPTYSLTVTLFALLIFTGLGSLASSRYVGRRNRTLMVLLGCLLALVVFYRIGMPPLVARTIGYSLAVRIALSVVFLAPLGLCLGAFMPLGLRTIAGLTDEREAFVAWAWAVNGFFSVVSSVLATILSMTLGFKAVLLAAALVYVLGATALMTVPAERKARA